MSESGVGEATASLAVLSPAVDRVLDSSLTRTSTDQLYEALRNLQSAQTRLRMAQLNVIAELQGRPPPPIASSQPLRETVQAALNLDRRDATRLVGDSSDLTSRRALTGPVLPPSYPVVASALAIGAMTFAHARVIRECVDRLTLANRAEHGHHIETTLTHHAETLSPLALRRLADRISAHVDPDGPPPPELDDIQHARRRFVWQQNGDGTVQGQFVLTASTAAVWAAVLTTLASRRETDVAGPDTRSDQQRWHDAVDAAGRRLLRSRTLPDHAGLPTSLIITTTTETVAPAVARGARSEAAPSGRRATTQHGIRLTSNQAMELAVDPSVLAVALNPVGGVVDHGRERRLASRRQRLALIARDRGCTFPGCTTTAGGTEAHHVVPWADGGTTVLSNLALACGYHNNEAPRLGWTSAIGSDGVPRWTPPAWIDPNRLPRRNYQHHPELLVAFPQPAPAAVRSESETSSVANSPSDHDVRIDDQVGSVPG